MNIPNVIELNNGEFTSFDLYSRLLRDRIIWLANSINKENSNVICAQLLFLEMQDPFKPIKLYINSPGGEISAGLAIYDTMQYIKAPVHTYCIGEAASMAAVLLAAGEKHHRYSLPHSTIMIHQPSGGIEAKSTDIHAYAKNISRLKKLLNEILAKHTGQPIEKIEQDTINDNYMTAIEALEYGIIDQILTRRQ